MWSEMHSLAAAFNVVCLIDKALAHLRIADLPAISSGFVRSRNTPSWQSRQCKIYRCNCSYTVPKRDSSPPYHIPHQKFRFRPIDLSEEAPFSWDRPDANCRFRRSRELYRKNFGFDYLHMMWPSR